MFTNITVKVKSRQTDGIKTYREMNNSAIENVGKQSSNYFATKAYETSKSGINTETEASHIKADTKKAAETYSQPDINMKSGTYKIPYVSSMNIKTQSEIRHESTQKASQQSEHYYSTGAYTPSGHNILENKNRVYSSVSKLKTGTIKSISAGNNSNTYIDSSKEKKLTESGLKPLNNIVTSKLQSEFSKKEDLGSQSAGMGIKIGNASSLVFRTTQAVPDTVKTFTGRFYKIGNGMYQVGITGSLSVVAVAKTVTKLKEGKISPISPEAVSIIKGQAIASGLNSTDISRRIIHSVNKIQTGINSAVLTATQIGKSVTGGYRIIKGAIKGKLTFKISKKAAAKYIRKVISKNLVTVNGNLYKLGKTGAAAVTKGIPWAIGSPGANIGIRGIAGSLSKSDDYAVQGVGTSINMAEAGIRTAIKGTKVSSYAIKTAVKTGKKTVHAGMFIKNNGLRAAWKASRGHAVKSAQNILKALIDGIKALGRKVIIPILIIATVVMACSGVITIPVTAVASIFGSIFSTKDSNTDHDIRDYLNAAIPGLVTKFQEDLSKRMEKSWEDHHIVRFYSNLGSDDVIEPTLNGIKRVFPSNDEINNMIQPVFNAVVLMKYELEPTEKEAEELTKEIFSKLFTVSTEESTEYCGQDLLTGKGTPIASHLCGSIHAKDDCPNKITGTHSGYTCDTCCSYYCPGHATADGGVSYCSGCTHTCSGYSYCGSHSVISYTLSVDGIYRLEAEYFLNPIEELSIKDKRTKEEESNLAQLKDYHEIFKEMMSQTAADYGGGMTMSDLSGIKFTDGKRKKNQAVIDLALSQVGQIGGQPYWSHYGFAKRVEWCACFVNWCMRNTPSATDKYQKTSNNAYCQTVADNFSKIGQWGDRNYADIVAGDTIFFDWNGDGHTDHIGLVIGTDGTKVYTVEGNNGDAVKLSSYPVGSSVIYGYGLMNY